MLGKTAYNYYYGVGSSNERREDGQRREKDESLVSGKKKTDEQLQGMQDQQQAPSPPLKREKTCDRCHTKLAHAQSVEQHLPRLRRATVAQLTTIVQKGSNKELQAAAVSLLRTWREIQYVLPTQQPNSLETQMLQANWSRIAHHSCWRVMLAKAACANNVEKNLQEKIIGALCEDQDFSRPSDTGECKMLLCREQVCRRGWSLEACVTLLQDEQFAHTQVFRSCAVYLSRPQQSTVDLSLFVINLCWAVRFEPVERRKAIGSVLETHAARDGEFFSDVFWHCMSAIHDLSISNTMRRYYVTLLKHLRASNATLFDQLYAGKRMLQALDASGKVQAVQDSDTCFPEFTNQELFRMPINSQYALSSFDLQSSRIMRSATRPMVVPCCCTESNPPHRFNVLLKREDVRMDSIILNTMRYMRRLLEREFAVERLRPLLAEVDRTDAELCRERDQQPGQDRFGIVCYRCVPTSNVSGVIEMVPQSTTLDDVQNKYDTSIMQFVRSKNRQIADTELLRDRFMRSTAASCVITYLLGIGDRHLENIMLTRDGNLFHIDFGYVMGDDPKRHLIGSPSMRLTNEMVDALGGLESECYERFQRLCTDIFNFLRREYTTVALLLMPLTYIGKCSVADMEREIQTRFVPTETKTQANIQLSATLNDSRGSQYIPSVVDIIHSGGKSAGALLTEPVMAIASLIPKSLTTSLSSSTQSNAERRSGDSLSRKSSKEKAGGEPDALMRASGNNNSGGGNSSNNSGGSGNNSSGAGSSLPKAYSSRHSFERETAALGRGVQTPLRSPLGVTSPLQERLSKEKE
jgi:hypothetical protein